jgi:NitT/TauT family transport system substrate-binding protein
MKFLKSLAATLLALASTCTMAQTKVVLGHTGIADYAASYIAQEEGFFRKHGLQVEFQQVFGPALAPGLQSESMQITTMTPSSFLLAVDGGLKLVAVANTTASTQTDRHYALAVKEGSTIKTAKDLVGKKVGVPGIGLTLHVLARKALVDQGVDPRKVNFVEVPFPQLNDVLRGGGVDAIATAEPFITRTLQSRTGQVIDYFFERLPVGTSPVFYVSSAAWADKNPQTWQAFRAALNDAGAFAAQNPDKVRAIIGKYVKLPPDVLAAQPLPRLDANINEAQVRFWIDTLAQQDMLKAKLNAASLMRK